MTTTPDRFNTHQVHPSDAELVSPYTKGGLVEVFRRRYLLRLLVSKEVQGRYQGSLLGVLWTYIQPFIRFSMYFFVLGLIIGLHKNVPYFAIHMFAALVAVHFFNETFGAGTRSIAKNKSIVRKLPMPREMFPVASVIVSAVNSFPQLVILFVAALFAGWAPDPVGLLAAVLGLSIVTVLGTALALLFSAMNVYFRDFQSIVATISMLTTWVVPMIYPFSRLAESGLGGNPIFYTIYLCNPLTWAVLLIQRGFWIPTTLGQKGYPDKVADVGFPYMPHHLMLYGVGMLLASCVILVLCQLVFRRLEGQFAERL